jgi:hypothetical protein
MGAGIVGTTIGDAIARGGVAALEPVTACRPYS